MTYPNQASGTPAQPLLADLFARYLQRQAAGHGAGLGMTEPPGEVVPFDAAPVQSVDPRLAWQEAVAAVRCFQPEADTRSWQVPPDWASLVNAQEPTAALAFCIGNFPQLVRNLQSLLDAQSFSSLRPDVARAVHTPALKEWAFQLAEMGQYPQVLLGLGALRLARQFDQAAELTERCRALIPAPWQAAWANEEAALAWHRGQAEKAVELWRGQAESVPVLFNRGTAGLFLDQPGEARRWLKRAVDQIPDECGWHHLGCLYLALAEMRS